MTVGAEAVPAGARLDPRRLVQWVDRLREFGILAALGLLVLVTASIAPRFLEIENIRFILVDTTLLGLLALGESMVVITRNVDLSIGSVLGLSAFVCGNMFSQFPGIPIPV